ncbi:hypothetical protein MTR67_047447 [Solanum verrucosum]|uniref:Dephospho-CoA kinase n=1 Tax=Solanum verrucosum TaxID=315347 RepID=A0AAF0ZVL9_SOLVR|nr:hypothetical protein MTR67_047447 [Solanum verrucosum]
MSEIEKKKEAEETLKQRTKKEEIRTKGEERLPKQRRKKKTKKGKHRRHTFLDFAAEENRGEKGDMLSRLLRLQAPFISRGILMEVLKLWIKGCSIIVLDVPLLFEAKMDKWTKPIVVVWVDPKTQLQRLMIRDESMEEEAKNRINAQMSLDLKRSKADIVIDNTSSLEALHEQFQKVLTQITKPLTWTEFMLARNGALLALFSTFVSVAIFKKSA